MARKRLPVHEHEFIIIIDRKDKYCIREIVHPWIRRAGPDIAKPTKKDVVKLVEKLGEMDAVFSEPENARTKYERRMKWLDKV